MRRTPWTRLPAKSRARFTQSSSPKALASRRSVFLLERFSGWIKSTSRHSYSFKSFTSQSLKPQTSTITTNPPLPALLPISATNARTRSHWVLTCRRRITSPSSLRTHTVNCLRCWSIPRYNIVGSPAC